MHSGPAAKLRQTLGDAGPRQQRALGVVVEVARDQAVEQLLGRGVGGHLQGRELRILVVRIVAAALVELDLADVRRVDRLIPALDQLGLHEVLEDAADGGALGHPEDQPGPDQRRDREQAELLAELAMVALPGLLDLREVGVELLLVEEGRAVDALEHLAVGLPLPVGAGDREQLERPDLAGVGDVRAPAEVDELALAVEAEDAELVQLVVDVLDLERLAQVGDELAGLVDGQAEPLERLGVLEDPGHLGLDGREVILREVAAVDLDVVIEPLGRRRPERQPDAREQPHDGPGHDVRGGMAEDVERLAVPGRQDPQLDRAGSFRSRSRAAGPGRRPCRWPRPPPPRRPAACRSPRRSRGDGLPRGIP